MSTSPHWRMMLAGMLITLCLQPTHAQRKMPPPLVQKLPVESPEAIVMRILAQYRDNAPKALDTLPFVPRLQDALRRTDLAADPIAEPDRAVSRLMIDMAETMGDKRVSVAAWFSHGSDERLIHFDFDVTSGDWQITDIRPRGGASLRQLLRINR